MGCILHSTLLLLSFFYVFLLGVFEENCSTPTVGRFFRRVRSTVLFICSTTWTTEVQNTLNLRTPSKTKRNKTDVQNLENIQGCSLWPSSCFSLRFFLELWDFFWNFLDCTKRSPLHLVRYFATEWILKNQKGSSFYIFRHCDTVQKSHFLIFFSEFF